MENVKNKFSNNLFTLFMLSKRNLTIFLKDKVGVFFSLLAPLIVLVLYVLFLGDIQVSSVTSNIPAGLPYDEKLVGAFVDSWMIAGVLGVSLITVSFGANSIMVQDKEKGILNDAIASPVKKWVVTFSYFLYNFIVTIIISTIIFAISLVYLAVKGSFYMTVLDILGTFGVILLGSLSSTLITVFISSFIKTATVHGSVSGILSAVIGFVMGAYMPISIMPKFAQYISAVLPASYAAGLFRNTLMRGSLEKMSETLPIQFTDSVAESFSMKIDCFGKQVGVDIMVLILAISVVLFALINVILSAVKAKKHLK